MLPVYIPLASLEKSFSFENLIRLLTGETERMSREKLQTVYFERFFFQVKGITLLEETFSDVNAYAFLTMPLRKSGSKYYLTSPAQTQAILYYLSLNPDAITEYFRQIAVFLHTESDKDKIRYLLSKCNKAFISEQYKLISDNVYFQEYWDYYLQMLKCNAYARAIGLLFFFSVLNIDAYYLLQQFSGDVLFSEKATQNIETTATYVMQSALNSEMFLGIQYQRNMNDVGAEVLCTIGRGELSRESSCFTFEPIPRKNSEQKYDGSDGIEAANSHDQSAFTLLAPLGAMEGVIRDAVQANSYDETNYELYYIKVNGQYLQLVNNLLHTQVILGEKNERSKWKIIFHDGWVSIKPWADIPSNVFALDVPNGRRLPGTAIWLFFKHDTLSQHFKLYRVID